MLLALAVLAVVTTVTAAAMAGRAGRLAAERGARDVFQMARLARGRAVLDSSPARLVVDRDANTIRLETVADPIGAPGVYAPWPGPAGQERGLPDDVAVAAIDRADDDRGPDEEPEETPDLVFHPDGRGPAVTIWLVARDGTTAAVAIDGLTGESRILSDEEIEYEAGGWAPDVSSLFSDSSRP